MAEVSAAQRPRTPFEWVIVSALRLSVVVSVGVTLGIIVVLFGEAALFFREVPLGDFLGGTRWAPLLEPRDFGVLPLVCGTLLVTTGACLLAVPVGVATAIYLNEYASDRARAVLKPAMEVLAGIPTVVYGYFALTVVTPALRVVFPQAGVFNAASAASVVGIMIVPMVASLSDDAYRAVPSGLRQASLGLGATRMETAFRIIVPAALSGILASVVLAFSRAVGETMAVTLAAGATPQITANPLESVQTMTAYIVQVSLGDTPRGGVEYQTIFAVGSLLFVITFVANVLANYLVRRFRMQYE